MMDWLKLLGFDKKKPFKSLLSLLKLFALDKVNQEIYEYLDRQIDRKRRVDLAVKLREAAVELEADRLGKAAEKLAEILRGVKL
jgi:hypothetical protein